MKNVLHFAAKFILPIFFLMGGVAAGDINGDGKADLIVGIPGKDAPATKIIKDAGAVQVISAASF